GLGDALEDLQRVALRRPVLQADHRESAHRGVRIVRRQLVEQRAERIHVPWVVARKAFERDQRRAARCWALVLEPASQELELLTDPDRRDRAIGLRTTAVVRITGAGFDLLAPLRPDRRERALVSRLCQGVRLGSRLRE